MKILFVIVPIVIVAMAAGWMHAASRPPTEAPRAATIAQTAPEKVSNDAEILRAAKAAAVVPSPKPAPAPKPSPPDPVVPPPQENPGAFVKLRGASLSDACTAVSAQSGIVITLDPAIASITIDLDVESCTAQQFVEYICEIAGAESIQSNGGILIRPKKE